jgi:UDP-N-acetylmuramoyl-tripeptide--D-alanyl-D-alanine ligase
VPVSAAAHVAAALVATAGPPRLHGSGAWVTTAACLVAAGVSGVRWLRVAQREHYLAGSVALFALRWWRSSPANVAIAVAALVAVGLSFTWPLVGLVTAAVAVVGPFGLTLRGRTSALAWTRRLRTLAAVTALLLVLVVGAGALLGPVSAVAVIALVVVPVLVDLACALTAPVEHVLAGRHVARAARRLAAVAPTVVGVTGSYGKTSTKGHIAQLVAGSRTVVATPASYNNRAGLARAVNEHLAEGTDVFVAEMGTYGPGEIAKLCRWCPPDVAVITAIGPVHLERFGTEERIVGAKSEILERASTVVLAVDDDRLAAVAGRAAEAGKRVVRCSARDHGADVCVEREAGRSRATVWIGGGPVAGQVDLPTGVQPSNLACAIGVALALGIEPAVAVGRLRELHGADHRLQRIAGGTGAVIVDDTYNANPAGAREALAALTAAATPGDDGIRVTRRVVVTPGMVELGRRQAEENRRFAAAAAEVATDVVVVGRTNRRALLAGLASGGATGRGPSVRCVARRDDAVAWVRDHVTEGDAVLYENDLPDHYP